MMMYLLNKTSRTEAKYSFYPNPSSIEEQQGPKWRAGQARRIDDVLVIWTQYYLATSDIASFFKCHRRRTGGKSINSASWRVYYGVMPVSTVFYMLVFNLGLRLCRVSGSIYGLTVSTPWEGKFSVAVVLEKRIRITGSRWSRGAVLTVATHHRWIQRFWTKAASTCCTLKHSYLFRDFFLFLVMVSLFFFYWLPSSLSLMENSRLAHYAMQTKIWIITPGRIKRMATPWNLP